MDGSFRLLVEGNDVTSRFMGPLKSLSVTRSAGQSSDSLKVVLADVEGLIVMPKTRANIEASIGPIAGDVGWVFSGFVTEVSSRGDKEGGRELHVTGSSADHHSSIKSPATRSADDKAFPDVAKDWGSRVGLEVQVIGSASEIFRPYWIQQNESFMAWGQRMARELGLTFKVIGGQAFFSPRSEGISVSGRALPTIRAAYGENLKSWDITPVYARPRYSEVRTPWYDLSRAEWVEVAKEVPSIDVDAVMKAAMPYASKDHAEQGAVATSKESDRAKGDGSVSILGDYAAEPEALCVVSGTRPGIDGSYTIDGLSHSLSKQDGFETELTLKRPEGVSDDR